MKKITAIGDIMVEPSFLEYSRKGSEYDFYPAFEPLADMLADSDYVIANLETPLAGEAAGYTTRIVNFNAPDSLTDALKKLGVNGVLTSNNHCMDRGYDGLVRTIEVLDKAGIAHTGTYVAGYQGPRPMYFRLGDLTVAVIGYTYSSNYIVHGVALTEEQKGCVNYLRPDTNPSPQTRPMPDSYLDTRKFIEDLLGRKTTWEEGVKLKIAMHLPVPTTDELVDTEEQDCFFKSIAADYNEARKNADLVLFCPHSGGQFNIEPGAYSVRLMEKSVKLGFDAIMAAHSHTTQKAEIKDGKPCFYSLGNVTMSPCTFYAANSFCLPDYGMAAHLYVEDKKIVKSTFSLFKMVEKMGEYLRVVPVDVLAASLQGEEKTKLLNETAEVYKRITGRDLPDGPIQKEYDLA